ncbi:superoxide dismutase [Roseomonas populi]|uniref:Superoxide dismutase n=1 Tax=Roseomonas populi TaxID=3121582 RepID=A0ABT1X2H3_9PROT|nr:superoxide dismutase [Roseomonas pecuniae]MCR0981392.1 superoxide dismutase [Roseomonas pecuniae]
MAFSLPPLPYDVNALAARGMQQETLELHHGKHHQAYVTALNGLVESKGLSGKTLEQIVAEAGKGGADSLPVLNQAGQHWNHLLFWQCMSPNGGDDKIPDALKSRIESDLGGLQKFKDDFKAAGVGQFGSGWAWLIEDASGKLKITKTPNGANPISTGEGTPLLGVDVWEHSYYLDFRNRRPDYLSNFLDKLVNWEYVASLLGKGMQSGQSA